jgi:hypothetical protein
MKNIHILPTLQPSRLWFHKLNRNLGFSDLPMEYNGSGTWVEGRNIYITSDEEIKEGDWCIKIDATYFPKSKPNELLKLIKLDSNNGYTKNASYYNFNSYLTTAVYDNKFQGSNDNDISRYTFKNRFKKIILTTDQDLIKDGVQAIDDEFLEWFVNNPSCEEVEIYRSGNHYDGAMEFYHPLFYKIILPKEEPKKEPLEEAAEKWFKEIGGEASFMKAIEFGVKWQQEQDKKLYSEEEVIKLLQQYRYYLSSSKTSNIGVTTGLWFEQFKKK